MYNISAFTNINTVTMIALSKCTVQRSYVYTALLPPGIMHKTAWRGDAINYYTNVRPTIKLI